MISSHQLVSEFLFASLLHSVLTYKAFHSWIPNRRSTKRASTSAKAITPHLAISQSKEILDWPVYSDLLKGIMGSFSVHTPSTIHDPFCMEIGSVVFLYPAIWQTNGHSEHDPLDGGNKSVFFNVVRKWNKWEIADHPARLFWKHVYVCQLIYEVNDTFYGIIDTCAKRVRLGYTCFDKLVKLAIKALSTSNKRPPDDEIESVHAPFDRPTVNGENPTLGRLMVQLHHSVTWHWPVV